MRKLLFFFLLISLSQASLFAQSTLPEKYGIIVGGGVSFPRVDCNNNDFFNKNGNHIGYNLSTEARFYFEDYIALGFKYDYIRSSKYNDKMHVNFIAPEVVLRYNFSDSRNGIFISLAPGYMDYEERIYDGYNVRGHNYEKGYFAFDIALGYEFVIAKGFNGMLKMDCLTADWGLNPNRRLYNPDPDYDDGEDHSWFKNNITFLNLGFAIQFGK